MKRILGYSSIAHAGFILTGIIALNAGRHRRGAVLPARLRRGDGRRVRHRLAGAGARGPTADGSPARSSARPRTCRSGPGWAGRTRCSPLTFALFLLSFAGIPLTAGFVGKFARVLRRGRGRRVAARAHRRARVGGRGVLLRADHRADVLHRARRASRAGRSPPRPRALAPSAEGFALAGDAAVGASRRSRSSEARSTVTTTVVGTEGLAVVAIAVCALVTIVLGVFPSPVLDLDRVRGDVPAVTHRLSGGIAAPG